MKKSKKVTTTVTTTTTVVETNEPQIVETHYLLILDKSGSMSSVRNETIANFNEQVQTIKKLEKKYPDQKYFISLITFSDDLQEVMMDVPASEVKELTADDFVPDGMTALWHAMGQGISRLKDKISPSMNDTSKIVSSIVVIMTDGGENSSGKFPEKWTSDKLKPMIEQLNKDDRWTISFLGANQNAILTSSSVGIGIGNTLNYKSTSKGTRSVAAAMDATLKSRAKNIASGYSSIVGGDIRNMSYFSSVIDSDTIHEDLKLKDVDDDSNTDKK